MSKNFDVVAFVTDYETNELDEAEIREGFQNLVDSGEAWRLQGMYGRAAAAMLAAGVLHQPGER